MYKEGFNLLILHHFFEIPHENEIGDGSSESPEPPLDLPPLPHLLITIASSFDPDRAQQNVRTDLDTNCF